MTIQVHTRSCNDVLYEKMREFIPEDVECIRHQHYNHWHDAVDFLHDTVANYDGMVLILDEDNFITDWNAVVELATYVQDNGIAYCGVPDGGVLSHRHLSWITANPSFLILNLPVIKPKINHPRNVIENCGYVPSMDKFKPMLYGEFSHKLEECFSGWFFYLLQQGLTPHFLNGETVGDGISTAIKGLSGKTIAIHSWFSRTYNTDEANQIRIEFQYRSAKKLKEENEHN